MEEESEESEKEEEKEKKKKKKKHKKLHSDSEVCPNLPYLPPSLTPLPCAPPTCRKRASLPRRRSTSTRKQRSD